MISQFALRLICGMAFTWCVMPRDRVTCGFFRIQMLVALPLDGPPAPDDLLGVVNRDQLEQAFRRLTPDERAVIVLHHYVGYGLSEIAELLGAPAGTIRSRLHHAHRAMRAALDAEARTSTAGGRIA